MKRKPAIFTFLLLLLAAGPLLAQYDNLFFRLKPPAEKGMLLYEAGAYEKSVPHLEQALRQQHSEPLMLMLAHAYTLTGKANEAVRIYRQLGKPEQLEAKHLLAYTLCLQSLGRSEEARTSYQEYQNKIGASAPVAEDLGRSDLYRSAIRFSVHPLSINSRQNEFAPVITREGLLFVSDRKKKSLVKKDFSSHGTDLDVYKAEIRSNTRFVNTIRLPASINSSLHDGPISMDSTGNLYFSRSERKGKMSLWHAAANADKTGWEAAEKLKIDTESSLLHPAVNAEGDVLFFVSDGPGGYGGTDIWYCHREDKGWTAPVNAGPKVNSPGNEAFPVVQGNRLYYSSDGRIGLGKLDIYEAFISGTTVIHVRNMGAPVNSPEDDFGLAWLADGSGGYFASNRKGGRGGDDLYRLDYHIITLEGTLLDSTNHKPLAGARVALTNPDGSIRQAITNDAGAYTFMLYPGESYQLSVEAKNYRSRSLTYSTLQGKQWGKRPFALSLERKTKTFVLGNVRLADKKRAAQAQVLVYDMAGGSPDTILTNNRGGFELELDTDRTYAFLFECNDLGILAEFQTSGMSEASLSHYLNVDLQEQHKYKIVVAVDGSHEREPLLIWLKSSLQAESELLWPDKGKVTFDASSLVSYEVCVQQGAKSKVISLPAGWQQGNREVFIPLE